MNTKALRQKVLDLAIHGKLVPQNPNDESATVLLERIRAEKAEKIKKGELKADKKDSFIFVGSDKRHYEQFADGTVKDIEDEIPFDVPEGWAWTKIHCVSSEILYGVSESAKETGKYKLLRITDIQDDQVNWDSVPFTDFPEDKVSNYILKNGDIVFARTGATVGKSYLIENLNIESIYASYLIRIRTSLLLNPRYMKYYFGSLTYWNQITDKSSGIGQPNVNGASLANLYIPIPPYNEQERILSVIEKVFKLIDSLENDKDKLENLIKVAKSKILDLAIHGKLVPQDPNDEPAEELLKRIATSDNRPYEKVEEEPFEIPNSWKWVKLGDIGQTNIGLTYHPNDISNTGIIVLRSNNIQNDKLCFDDIVKVNSNTKILNNQYINNGDILICARNGSQSLVGKCVLLNNLKEKTSFGAFMAVFRSNYNRYILKYLQSKYFKDYMFESNSTQIHQLTQSMLKDALIPFPPEKEQVQIVAKIDELYSQLDQIQNNLV